MIEEVAGCCESEEALFLVNMGSNFLVISVLDLFIVIIEERIEGVAINLCIYNS
jgi:hypothetical protein